jgi:hypothetical protein
VTNQQAALSLGDLADQEGIHRPRRVDQFLLDQRHETIGFDAVATDRNG